MDEDSIGDAALRASFVANMPHHRPLAETRAACSDGAAEEPACPRPAWAIPRRSARSFSRMSTALLATVAKLREAVHPDARMSAQVLADGSDILGDSLICRTLQQRESLRGVFMVFRLEQVAGPGVRERD